jgi:hypothetical protein
MFILVWYTEILGDKSEFFAIFFIGEQYGELFPFLVPLGDLALGTYLTLSGGALGVIGAILPRND